MITVFILIKRKEKIITNRVCAVLELYKTVKY